MRLTKLPWGGILLLLTLGCASTPGALGAAGLTTSSAGLGLFLEGEAKGDDGHLPGAFFPYDSDSWLLDSAQEPESGALASRGMRRGGRAAPSRQPPLLNPRPPPAQSQQWARRAADLRVVEQARKLYRERLAEAQARYPNSDGYEDHHFVPRYLGGANNGQKYRLPTAYHKAVTQAFREEWHYGQDRPDPRQLQDILIRVYSRYPIPQLVGIEP
jgi:hypothetical protein